jgi:DNA-binding transcriptional LysR family regulator
VLNLTQPTLSHALGRLRLELADRLFVRAPGGVAPTARAEHLYPSFRQALQLIDQAIEEVRAFDPATSTRRFRLAMTDIGEMAFLPPIMRSIQVDAGSVSIEACQLGALDIGRALETGQLDFAIANMQMAGERTQSAEIMREHYVCMVRAGHPVVGDGMSMETYLAARHLAVATPFSGHGEIENALRERGRVRTVALQATRFTSVPDIIANTDLVVTLPSRVARFFASTYKIVELKLPLRMAPYIVYLHWHARSEADPGHAWMRDVIGRALTGI